MGTDEAGTSDHSPGSALDSNRAKVALRDNAAFLETILDNMGSQVYMKDLEGHYLLANRQVEIESGIVSMRICGISCQDLG